MKLCRKTNETIKSNIFDEMVIMHYQRALSYSRPFLRQTVANSSRARSYHINSTSSRLDDSIDIEVIAHNDTISRRLYRILLRSCSKGVGIANRDNSIDNIGSRDCLLLQPPMDPRKYGFAKIAKVRHGQSLQTNGDNNDVGMAMEVLKFVHVSLGGSADDDLHHYYLGATNKRENNNDPASVDIAAGRHSEGHYTQFLDESEDNGDDLTGTYGDISVNDNTDANEGEDEDELEFDESILVTTKDLMNAVRIAFRAPLLSSTPTDDETMPEQSIIQRRHRDAIDVSNLLSDQLRMWSGKSSVAVDKDHSVRVVATSACLMRSSTGVGVSGQLDKQSYKFAYRIRVENIADILDKKPDSGETSDDLAVEHRAMQLLGRSWRIFERRPMNQNPSLLQALMDKNNNGSDGKEEVREVQVVDEPRTGAVGHLPVLGPGEVFEYMSGAELSTPTGQMKGCFHMAKVDMQKTDTAHVGNPVEALSWAQDDERRFEATVGRFGFLVDDFNET